MNTVEEQRKYRLQMLRDVYQFMWRIAWVMFFIGVGLGFLMGRYV